jgi:anti-sigma B factor antagonist
VNILEEMNGGLMILRLQESRLDASTAPALRDALIERIENGQQSIILDLGEVGFMDSSALGALIAAVKKLGPVGTIAVAAMRTPVARLFTLTKMDRVFSVNATVDDAISSLGT